MKVNEDVTADVFAVIMDPKLPRERGLTAGSRTPRPSWFERAFTPSCTSKSAGSLHASACTDDDSSASSCLRRNRHRQDLSCLLCELFIEVLEA